MGRKNQIVADGPLRLLRGRRERSRESIEKKHAAEMAAASFTEKWQLRTRMAMEKLRAEKTLMESPPPAKTLW
jgi:hypothetical protein